MKNTYERLSNQGFAMTVVATLFATACATTMPVELSNARVAYGRASTGPAAQLVPADVHKAQVALQLAEKTFAEEKNTQKTVDLAYIAQRTAEIAEAHADSAIAEKKSS